ncbi:MAG: FMN-binding protein [Peptococcaceae bacterium]|jgi:electron transport complex protein RnfG|nr:FMN-binding protein [Peptococcaceae bacterium]
MEHKVIKLTVFLLLVTGISGLAIGYVNGITAPAIEIQKEESLRQGYREVYPDGDEYAILDYDGSDSVITGLVVARRAGADSGAIYTVSPKGYGGAVELLVGFDLAANRISGVKILTQSETPGLGANCSQPWFADRFLGKSAEGALALVKTAAQGDNQVQAITAATVTSTAVVDGVNAARADFASRYGGR